MLAVDLGRYKWYQSQTLDNVRERPKRTICASGGSGPLQMVSESDTRQCKGKTKENNMC